LPLYQGFIDEENQITCYTDHQILNAIINSILKQLFEKQNITLKELTTLSVGDYVTHIDHGIGRFGVAKNTGREQNTGSYKTGLC
jgi:transcription-repair coupling factor (superfamily II helicase)